MTIDSERLDDETVVISVLGESDLYTSPQLKRELLGAIEGGASNVIIDLRGTTFVDSATLGVLLSGIRRLRPDDGRIAVVVDNPNVRKIFEITMLDRVFPLTATVADARGRTPARV